MTAGAATSSEPLSSPARPALLKPMPSHRPDVPPVGRFDDGSGPAGADANVVRRLFPDDMGAAGDAPTMAADVAGLKLGQFLIEERIGHGGMGAVFRALDLPLDRVVALKVLAPSQSRDPAAAQRFQNEARAAARLDHENIARVHSIGADRGLEFIAFEYIHGTNIRDFIIQKGLLAPEDAVNYAVQIAQALRHTHAAGVVHRDIKPSNIIVTPAGRAKLVDLGLARQEDPDRSQDLTVAGTTLGTFDYIAPEQARDPRQVDVRADIYSLGCTLYHMLTGEPPYPQGSVIQKVVNHHGDAPPDPAQRNPRVSPQLSRIVRKMMASNPDERYPSPDHLIHDLVLVAHALGLRPTHPDGLVWTAPLYHPRSQFWERNRGWVMTLALLLLIVAGIKQFPWDGFDGRRPDASRRSPGAEGPPRALEAQALPSSHSLVERASDSAGENAAVVAINPGPGLPPAPEGSNAATADALELPATGPVPALFRMPPKWAASSSASLAALPAPRAPGDGSPADPSGQPPKVPPLGRAPTGTLAESGRKPEGGSAVSEPFVLLDTESGGEKGFPTLEAACSAAPKVARIELRFDGPVLHPQGPVRIENKQIVVRAQDGKHPVLVFRPSLAPGQVSASKMVSVLDAGGLKLFDVDVVVRVEPGHYADGRWAVFSLSQAVDLSMQGVSITLDNPQRSPAAFVELMPPANLDPLKMMPESMTRKRPTVDFEECLFRGNGDLLVDETLSGGELKLRNVATALRGALLRTMGAEMFDAKHDPPLRFGVHVRHVTALVEQGLLRVDAQTDREFLPLDIDCQDSVFIVRPDEPLVAMAGNQEPDVLQERLAFRGESTFFELDNDVWRIDPEFGARRTLALDQLGTLREVRVVRDVLQQPVAWRDADFALASGREFELRRLDDIESEPNPAAGAASDGSDAGVDWSERVPLGP
jgi:serine/threonine-protein kinase